VNLRARLVYPCVKTAGFCFTPRVSSKNRKFVLKRCSEIVYGVKNARTTERNTITKECC